MVSPPIILSLTMQEEILLKKFYRNLRNWDMRFRRLAERNMRVTAVPGNLYGLNGQSLLLELMDSLSSMSVKDTPELVVEKLQVCPAKLPLKAIRSYPDRRSNI